MNREILFRAWMKKKFSLPNASYDIFTLKELMSGKNDFYKYENWGRYTGLKDRNGTMIFESDILKNMRHHNQLVEVYWEGNVLGKLPDDKNYISWGGWSFKRMNKNENLTWAIYQNDIEVIGNIYEDKIK